MSEHEVKIGRKMQTEITNAWLAEFPEYKKISTRSWSKIIGPFSVDIGYDVSYGETIKLGSSIFNLTNPWEFICTDVAAQPWKRWGITYRQFLKGIYKEASDELKQRSLIFLEGDIKLSDVINAYKNYCDTICSLRHYEDPALIAAWAERLDLAQKMLDWGMGHFKKRTFYHELSNEEWYKMMQEKISNPKKLQETVEEQIVFHKLTKVPRYELIIDM